MRKAILVLLCTLALSQISSAATGDGLLIENANGFTFDNSGELIRFSSLMIQEGRVLAIDSTPLHTSYPRATVIDIGGKTLLPGLTDAHGHLMGLGYNLLSLDVRGEKSPESVSARVREYAEQNPNLKWIRGRGWNQVLWSDKRFPTAADLDRWVSDRPVWLRRIDGHAGWANSRALQIAGIDSQTVAPPGGEILHDADGKPTGILVDNAMSLLEAHIPEHPPEEMKTVLRMAQDHLLKLGVTGVHDAGISYAEYQLYETFAHTDRLSLRIYAMLSSSDPDLEHMLKQGHVEDPKGLLSIRSVKVYADGALGSRGAAMLADYSDKPGHQGLLLTSPEELRETFSMALRYGFQINVHAIGDRGVRNALDEFERQLSHSDDTKLRHRIEHSQVVSLQDIPRYKSLGIIPSLQPTHATSDMNMAEERIGKQRLLGTYAWRKFLDQGSPIAAGSDFPVELANPFFGIHAAVTRQDRKNQPPGGWIPEEAMTLEEALKSFTLNAAYAAHSEQVLGGLTKGKWADFIVVDRDIFTIPETDLWRVNVLETWVAGKKR